MKNVKMISALTVIVLTVFSIGLFAQDNPVKNQNKVQVREQVKTQLENQEQIQLKKQVKTQLKTKAQVHSKGFVDIDGDGINDNAIDSDGDGIPNGQDPDYVRPQDGTGNKFMKGNGLNQKGKMWGPGDGTGNDGFGPKDGTGFGSGSGSGSGNCDGTGPKGNRGGRSGKG